MKSSVILSPLLIDPDILHIDPDTLHIDPDGNIGNVDNSNDKLVDFKSEYDNYELLVSVFKNICVREVFRDFNKIPIHVCVPHILSNLESDFLKISEFFIS